MNIRQRMGLGVLIGLIFALMLAASVVPSLIEMNRSLATSQAILDDIETSLADIELQLGIVPTQEQKDE